MCVLRCVVLINKIQIKSTKQVFITLQLYLCYFSIFVNVPLPSIQTAQSHAYMHILSQAQRSDQHQLVPKTLLMRLENGTI